MRIGVDLGGTKIETAALDEQGKIVYRHRTATPSGSYQELIDTLQNQIHQCEQTLGYSFLHVGLCIPGIAEKDTGHIKNANLRALNGNPLAKDLSKSINKEVRLINDANSLIWSEYVDGAATGAETCFGVIIGTGTGGGVVVNNQLLTGMHGVAGEWGHNPLPDYNPEQDGQELPCYCGRRHCIETFLSGTGFAMRFSKKYGRDLSAENIVREASDGNAKAREHLMLYCDQLARSLASIMNVIDPEVIVLGGGMSNIEFLYERVPSLWSRYFFMTSGHAFTKLVKARHGDSSGVRGAAWL